MSIREPDDDSILIAQLAAERSKLRALLVRARDEMSYERDHGGTDHDHEEGYEAAGCSFCEVLAAISEVLEGAASVEQSIRSDFAEAVAEQGRMMYVFDDGIKGRVVTRTDLHRLVELAVIEACPGITWLKVGEVSGFAFRGWHKELEGSNAGAGDEAASGGLLAPGGCPDPRSRTSASGEARAAGAVAGPEAQQHQSPAQQSAQAATPAPVSEFNEKAADLVWGTGGRHPLPGSEEALMQIAALQWAAPVSEADLTCPRCGQNRSTIASSEDGYCFRCGKAYTPGAPVSEAAPEEVIPNADARTNESDLRMQQLPSASGDVAPGAAHPVEHAEGPGVAEAMAVHSYYALSDADLQRLAEIAVESGYQLASDLVEYEHSTFANSAKRAAVRAVAAWRAQRWT